MKYVLWGLFVSRREIYFVLLYVPPPPMRRETCHMPSRHPVVVPRQVIKMDFTESSVDDLRAAR